MNDFKVELIEFCDLSEEEKSGASDCGFGKEDADYIKGTYNGEVVLLASDAMEPEDATFGRDLNWILEALKKCYELGRLKSEELK